ncbi:GNAT family N-acetyltransferase [Marinoscillum sp. MHG1-6]|uniref:GNAT family N-acetyltransferase n=1 Tax=Marinoscillum sp. MHG1-6 TaxID=2959627 RepID=UPI002157C9F4|nr:GNAT family protein [Marinoscillum sp. MHG1-6]
MNTQILNTPITLENERVLLLPFEHARNDELKGIIFDERIWKYMGISMKTEKDFDSYVANTLVDKCNGLCYPFLVIDKLNDRVSGSTRYGYINRASEKCEIGWTWYGIEFQGTGLNKACKFELLNFGFETIRFRRIQFSADEDNLRSQKAIAKLGAQQEGIFRNNYIDSNGESRNDVYFSIIREDWDSVKKERFQEFG